ncbi:MAG: type II toxin-antitoxin system VapC family toxin [Thermoleophilia bacterium]|nr:type II toxin-antitoxin system VapC family toxin [Thermoleophilia bacterium]
MSGRRFVIDANVAIDFADRDIFGAFASRMAAPPFVRVETRSALHVAAVRNDVHDYARQLQQRIDEADIASLDDARQGPLAWTLADTLGWTKTYDAEYLAAAHIHGLPLATRDKRLRSAAVRVGVGLFPLP